MLSGVCPQEEEKSEGQGPDPGADRERQEAGRGEEARPGQADPGTSGLREDAGEAGRSACRARPTRDVGRTRNHAPITVLSCLLTANGEDPEEGLENPQAES